MKKLILISILSACFCYNPLLEFCNLYEGITPPLINPGLSCTDEMWLYCQKSKFNEPLNISSTVDWTNITAMEIEIQNYFLRSDLQQGLFKLCQARTSFENCFSGFYGACMNPLNFVKHNLDISSAYGFVSLFKSLEFDCNGGNIQATKNWACLYSIYISDQYKAARNECLNRYLSAVNQTGSDYCQAAQNLLPCMTRVFRNFDCALTPEGIPSPDIRWFECERYRVAFQIDGLCPKLSCSTQIFGTPGFYVNEAHVETMKKQKNDYYDSMVEKAKKRRR